MSIATDFIPKNIKLKIGKYRGVIWGKVVYRLAFISLFVSLWWFTSTYGANGLLPTPMATMKAMVTIFSDGEFFFHITNTIRRVLLPFVAVWAVSVVIGVAMGISQKAEQFFDIGIVIGLTIPGLAWAIISVMIFGLRPLSAYFAVFMIVLPIVTINFWEGVKDIDTDLIQMGEVFGLSRRKQITEIVLPQLLPYMFSAARFGLSISWKVVVIVEYLGFGNGVGYKIGMYYNLYRMDMVLAWVGLFALVMMVVEYVGFKTLENRALSWRPEVGLASQEVINQ